MFHYVYVLQSEKYNRWYIGYYPEDVMKRLDKHNRGEVQSTKGYLPWKLIFYEAYLEQEDALRRERYLKTNQGARMLKIMLKGYRSRREDRILLLGDIVG
ncbi:MAG: GIY-YIG nuclease family protein [Candidatus Saccharibacteria bacterium]